jgi:hypothetical protein
MRLHHSLTLISLVLICLSNGLVNAGPLGPGEEGGRGDERNLRLEKRQDQVGTSEVSV